MYAGDLGPELVEVHLRLQFARYRPDARQRLLRPAVENREGDRHDREEHEQLRDGEPAQCAAHRRTGWNGAIHLDNGTCRGNFVVA